MSEKYFLQVEYKMVSDVPNYEPDRYINTYQLSVLASTLEEEKYYEIGRGEVRLILESLAVNDHFDMFNVFDSFHTTMELGGEIYDFDERQIIDEIRQFYDDDILYPNILLLERLELAKEYRGLGIGKRVIKDIVERFSFCAGLIALKAFPLQLESGRGLDDDWKKRVALEELERDEEKVKYKLYHYYQNLGFESPLNNEFFFINPALKNKKFESISLE
ncbi:MAG: hypothetical protein FH748_01350 [Balneolaceae bacterium]|nr:hypothetical protein [Balneolaceae bacterium]